MSPAGLRAGKMRIEWRREGVGAPPSGGRPACVLCPVPGRSACGGRHLTRIYTKPLAAEGLRVGTRIYTKPLPAPARRARSWRDQPVPFCPSARPLAGQGG